MINIYCDGACRNNQNTNNIGAWAYWMECPEEHRTLCNSKAVLNTTNNKMELQAAIEALSILKEPAKFHDIFIYSDSQYLVSGMNTWRFNWQLKNWKDVKNANLWQELIQLSEKFPKITFIKVKGHSDNFYNNYVDTLCNNAMDHKI